MVVRANKFTPEVLLSAPRRSAGVPNPSGTLVAYTVSTYSFDEHKKSTSFEILSVADKIAYSLVVGKDVSELNWISDEEVLYLQATTDGDVELWYRKVANLSSNKDAVAYAITTLGSTAGNLKVRQLPDHTFAVALSTERNAETASRTLRSSGKLYNGLFVRHWDRYENSARNTLSYAHLTGGKGEKYVLSSLIDLLKNTPFECPIRPGGGTDCFDISQDRIIFTTKDPELNPALNTKVNVYLQTIASWSKPVESEPEQLYVADYEGAMTSPVFSPDGAKAAFLAMKRNDYEADKNRIFIVSDVKVGNLQAVAMNGTGSQHDFWDRSPSSLAWSNDGTTIFATADDIGLVKLFILPLDPSGVVQPSVFNISGSIAQVNTISDNRVLLSGSSLIDNSLYVLVRFDMHESRLVTQQYWEHSIGSNRFGLSQNQVSSIWTPASNPKINNKVHSWVVRPSNFDEGKKYPVAYLFHGGPQGSWGDSWSTRWNPAVFAEQGYIVVAPNITGSTGYGQEFTDAIRQNWGGDPYHDIINVFEWVGGNLPGADNRRAVALGASYGGYMVNWIQGHDFGRKFKALVCHDGIFCCANMLSSDELYFVFHDFGGTPFYNPDKDKNLQALAQFRYATYASWRRWDPAEHLEEWATPELVIHSSKDYRIAISEGLAAFNVLQARGVESQFLTFPDENHWVLKPENSLLWHKVVFSFINKHVGLPAYTEVTPEDEAFFGGVKTEAGELGADMPVQGRPET